MRMQTRYCAACRSRFPHSGSPGTGLCLPAIMNDLRTRTQDIGCLPALLHFSAPRIRRALPKTMAMTMTGENGPPIGTAESRLTFSAVSLVIRRGTPRYWSGAAVCGNWPSSAGHCCSGTGAPAGSDPSSARGRQQALHGPHCLPTGVGAMVMPFGQWKMNLRDDSVLSGGCAS